MNEKGDDYDYSPKYVSNDKYFPEPKWHPIKLSYEDTESRGEILCSMIVNDDSVFSPLDYKEVRMDKVIKRKDFTTKINILGLRELASIGLIPVRKPFIKFNLKSMLPREDASAVINQVTEYGNGANPNFNTIITFSANLPVKESYCQQLTCNVYDFCFAGLNQPLIGQFGIDIGKIRE